MKKSNQIIIVLVAAVIGFLAGAVGMRMCGGADSPIESNQEQAEQTDDPSKEVDNAADRLCYYGCPNSRRVKKLNLFKSRRVL